MFYEVYDTDSLNPNSYSTIYMYISSSFSFQGEKIMLR